MKAFVYTVWFRDPAMEPEDQDYEWCACIRIIAAAAETAQAWGDHLSKRRSQNGHSDIFLKSDVEVDDMTYELDQMPSVTDGDEASDAFIGW